MPFKPEEREYRNFQPLKPDDGDKEGRKVIRGYACTFEDPYELFSTDDDIVLEEISKDAFEKCNCEDVVLQYNHSGFVYSRTRNNSLIVKPDEHGLFTEASLMSQRGQFLYDDISLGLIDKMSFGFIVGTGNDEWDHSQIDPVTNRRIHKRRINRIKKLFDVSVVDFPANNNTQVLSLRNFCNGVIAEFNEELEKRKAEVLDFELKKQRAIMRARLLKMGGNL